MKRASFGMLRCGSIYYLRSAPDEYGAGVRRIEPQHAPEGRGLPASVGAGDLYPLLKRRVQRVLNRPCQIRAGRSRVGKAHSKKQRGTGDECALTFTKGALYD